MHTYVSKSTAKAIDRADSEIKLKIYTFCDKQAHDVYSLQFIMFFEQFIYSLVCAAIRCAK